MKKSFVVLILILMVGCSERNPYGSPELLWEIELFETQYGGDTWAPVAGKDGSVYYADNKTSDGEYYYLVIQAYSSDGVREWSETFESGSLIPVVASDGNLFCSTSEWNEETESNYGVLCEINSSSGSVVWSTPVDGLWSGRMQIGADGNLYCGGRIGNDYYVVAFDRSGNKLWEFSLEENDLQGLQVAPDGTIYVTSVSYDSSVDGIVYLYAINSDGSLKWKRESEYGYAFIVGADGTLYFDGSPDNSYLYAVNPDGTLNWTYEEAVRIGTNKIGSDGTIYILANEPNVYQSHLHALNPDGTLQWKYTEEDVGRFELGSDGSLYIAANGFLYAFNPDKTIRWRHDQVGAMDVSEDGVVYMMVCESGKRYWEYYLQALQ
jgi:hypothetical protein